MSPLWPQKYIWPTLSFPHLSCGFAVLFLSECFRQFFLAWKATYLSWTPFLLLWAWLAHQRLSPHQTLLTAEYWRQGYKKWAIQACRRPQKGSTRSGKQNKKQNKTPEHKDNSHRYLSSLPRMWPSEATLGVMALILSESHWNPPSHAARSLVWNCARKNTYLIFGKHFWEVKQFISCHSDNERI